MEIHAQLASRFREVMLNGKWIANTNYRDLLSDVSFEEAIQKVGSLNTIAALTFHINYYIKGILNVFEGGKLEIRDKYSFDMTPVQSQDDWNAMVAELFSNSENFAAHLEGMSSEKLNSVFVDEKYGSYQRNIEAMIEHAYYHLGQLSLIKKILRNS